MAKRKVRHSLVQYSLEGKDGRKQYEIAFRNQIVDIPDDQVERLDSLGATVLVDEDLPRPGKMLELPETATDELILSWVMGATKDEVADLVRKRPVMAPRIESAYAAVQERFKEQNEHLGGLRKIAEEAEAAQASTPEKGSSDASGNVPETPAAPETPADGGANDDDLIGTPAEFTAEEADKVVAEGAKVAQEHLSNNPGHANIVLEAEGRLAEKEKRDPRISIVRAAEAAAGFTQ